MKPEDARAAKVATLTGLHARSGAFVIANAHDAGSARLLEDVGFSATATTSAGFAFTRAQTDYAPGREAVLDNAAAIVAATSLPVSADLENGFGHAPEDAAETIRLGVAAGLAGGSIEDATGDRDAPLYDIPHAAERVAAAAEAAHAAPGGFVLTARAENYLWGRRDLGDVIARLRAYQDAGADVLYAPGLTTEDDIRAVVDAVDRPVNVVMGLAGARFSLAELSAMGVKRVSVGSALARAAFAAVERGAREMLDAGTFEFAAEALSSKRLNTLFSGAG